MIEVIDIIKYPAIFIIGLMIGSFLNVCIYRIPRKESIVFPASHCPKCGKEIPLRDNIPVLSFLFLKGRCRFCREKISIRYPLIELSTAIILVLMLIKYQLPMDFTVAAFFACILILLSAIDIEHMVIPNKIIIPALLIGALLVVFSGYQNVREVIIGFIAGGGTLLAIAIIAPLFLKQEGLGGGDIKLAAFIGIFLGRYVLIALFISFLLGGLVGVVVMILKGKKRDDRITFGPFLSAGALITIFFGANLWLGYSKLIGLQ